MGFKKLAILTSLTISQMGLSVELPENIHYDEQGQLIYTYMGKQQTVEAKSINFLMMDYTDCLGSEVADKVVEPESFFQGTETVDPTTGNIAVGVDMGYCAAYQQSAVAILDPSENGVGFYRLQVPGQRDFPIEFASYPIGEIDELMYLPNGNLQVVDVAPCGAMTMRQFSPKYGQLASPFYPRLLWIDESDRC